MRWERLFDDLEAQLAETVRAGDDENAREEVRWRAGSLTMRERLLACRATPAGVRLSGGDRLDVTIHTVGADWFAGVADPAGRAADVVVRTAAVSVLRGASSRGAARVPPVPGREPQPAGSVGGPAQVVSAPRVTLPMVLRDLCRRRAAVTVRGIDGVVHGTIDQVGLDHFDLAVHERGIPRRAANVTAVDILAIAGIMTVEF
ncbi:MAG TPA: hypothetical protein VFQ96_01045 [Microbacteriaceae bacterium]|nr:hypothetical protein [Microbacteriaceae bacterium]